MQEFQSVLVFGKIARATEGNVKEGNWQDQREQRGTRHRADSYLSLKVNDIYPTTTGTDD